MTEPILILADVIQHELGLKDGQVMTAYQRFTIPTEGLFIVLTYAGPSQIIGSADEIVDDQGLSPAPYNPLSGGSPPIPTGGMTEIQSITILYTIQIDVMAFSDDDGTNQARSRKEEVAMAVNSVYSQQNQEENQMQISRQPGPFRDTSFLESTEFLQRYTTDVRVTAATTKTKPADYYNDLSRAVPPLLTVNA
jgi:hypothetical protein